MVKPSKKPRRKKPVRTMPAAISFNEILRSVLDSLETVVVNFKNRKTGAQMFGVDGMFICALEALHNGRIRGAGEYINAAAYAVAAAMQAANVWDYPLKGGSVPSSTEPPTGPSDEPDVVEEPSVEEKPDAGGPTEKEVS